MNNDDDYRITVLHTLSVIISYLDILSWAMLEHRQDEQMIPVREQARIALDKIGEYMQESD